MKIDCYLSTACGAESELRDNIFRALDLEGLESEVNFYRVDDREAGALGLSGSPSVFIDGEEVQPAKIKGSS
jgi:hypothetical protein